MNNQVKRNQSFKLYINLPGIQRALVNDKN